MRIEAANPATDNTIGCGMHDDLELIRQVSGEFAGAPVALSLLRGGNDRRVGQAMTVTAKLSKKRIDSARQPYSELLPEISAAYKSITPRPLRISRSVAASLIRWAVLP